MSSIDLERRRPVWKALAELFLDTETRRYIPRIAGVLADSGYDESEIRTIWYREVVPECAWNCIQVAGNWAAMPLEEDRLRRRATGYWSISTVLWQLPGLIVRKSFSETQRLRRQLSDYEPARRPDYVTAGGSFAGMYFQEQFAHELFRRRYIDDLRGTSLSKQECQRSFETDFQPIFEALLIDDEMSDEVDRTGHVHQMIELAYDTDEM